MTDSDRRELEAIVYGRSSDEAARADAMRRLREMDAPAYIPSRPEPIAPQPARHSLPPAAQPAPEPAHEASAPEQHAAPDLVRPRRRVRWRIAAVASLGVAAVLAVAWFTQPPAQPSITADRGAPNVGATQPQGSPAPHVEPGTDLLATPPPGMAIDRLLEGELTSAIALGDRDGLVAYGLQSATQACVAVILTTDSAMGQCRPLAEFEESGISIKPGKWSVTWNADGSVVWDGL